MSDIAATLEERGTRYGVFMGHASITQDIKARMQESPKWGQLEADQKEALEMVAHKIGRILNGDPNYHDSWHDIVGYAKLVADRLLPPAARGASAEENTVQAFDTFTGKPAPLRTATERPERGAPAAVEVSYRDMWETREASGLFQDR